MRPSGLRHTVHKLETHLDISSCCLHNSSRPLQARSDLHVAARGTLSAVGDILRPLFQTLRWYSEPSGGGQCPIYVARESQQHLDRKSIKAFKLLAHLFSRCEGNDYKYLQAIHTHTHRTTLWVVLRKSTIVGSVSGHIFPPWVWLWILAGLLTWTSTHHSHSSWQVTIIDQDFNLSRPGMCGLGLFFV